VRVHQLAAEELETEAARLPLNRSFFASVGFARLWETMGGRPRYWAAEDGGRWIAVLPAVEFGRGLLRRLQSMPDGCYGGILVAEAAAESDAKRAREALLQALMAERWFRVHLVDNSGQLEPPHGFSAERRQTRLVDIRDPKWLPKDKKLQSQIRSAERQGIRIEPFDWRAHGDGFMRLVQMTARRHRRAPAQPRTFYRALWQLSLEDERVRWTWCSLDGGPACSHIYFREGDMLQGWQIQFDKSASRLKANQFVRYRMCKQMASEGCTHLNLGATPTGAESLLYYKRRWGGDRHGYACWVYRSSLARLVRR
jgi:hypothetical protein